MSPQQPLQFSAERSLPMVLFLPLNVSHDHGNAVATDRKRAEAALPSEFTHVLLVKPVRCRLFDLPDHGRRSYGRIESPQDMDVIVVAADVNVGYAEVARRRGDVGVDSRTKGGSEEWTSAPRREDDVKID